MSGVELKMFTKMKDHVVEVVEETLAWLLLHVFRLLFGLMLVEVLEFQLHSMELQVLNQLKQEYPTKEDATHDSLTTHQIQLI